MERRAQPAAPLLPRRGRRPGPGGEQPPRDPRSTGVEGVQIRRGRLLHDDMEVVLLCAQHVQNAQGARDAPEGIDPHVRQGQLQVQKGGSRAAPHADRPVGHLSDMVQARRPLLHRERVLRARARALLRASVRAHPDDLRPRRRTDSLVRRRAPRRPPTPTQTQPKAHP